MASISNPFVPSDPYGIKPRDMVIYLPIENITFRLNSACTITDLFLAVFAENMRRKENSCWPDLKPMGF